jgi:hypothetical protein
MQRVLGGSAQLRQRGLWGKVLAGLAALLLISICGVPLGEARPGGQPRLGGSWPL